METFSGVPPASTPQVRSAPTIALSPAQVALLQQAFCDKTKVMVEKKFAGYSGAAIYLVTCDSQAPVVVKLDHPYHIRQEYAAYQHFVKDHLPLIAARIEQPPVIHAQGQLGLLIYTFIGAAPERPASSLLDYYEQQGGKATAALLSFIFESGEHWWQSYQRQRIFVHEAYDLLLPAALHLRVGADACADVSVLAAQAMQMPLLRQLLPGQTVRLEGFQVIKVRPDVLTLSVPALPGQPPSPPYLRIEGKLDQAYQPGDALAPQAAMVEATQLMRLTTYATACFPGLTPTQPHFFLEGRQYRNPLYGLTDLLDKTYSTNVSIIHGDLNLQNIMVLANREQQTRFAWLIDFAQTRRGPTLLDLQRLEVQIITKLLPTEVKPGHLVMLLEALHSKLPCARAPVASLQEPYAVLVAVRRIMAKYLIDSDKWEEYYRGLALVCLGALKFEELPNTARQRALLAAAIALDLAPKPPALYPVYCSRWWVRRGMAAVLLLVIVFLASASIIPAPQVPENMPLPGNGLTATATIAPRYWTVPKVGLRFVYVPGGTFMMGSPAGAGGSDEYPHHPVTVAGFWMSETEVTNQQYGYFVAAGGYAQEEWWTAADKTWRAEVTRQQPAYGSDPQWNQPNYPVIGVSWYEAVAYTNWLSQALSLTVRLPTEAEWERAARGDDGRLYPWGNQPPDETRGNFDGIVGKTTAVGAYPRGASPYGVLDMAGNVWEWTSSQYLGYPYLATDGREEMTAAVGRVARGGSWKDRLTAVRSAGRRRMNVGTWGTGLGLRLVIDDPLPPVSVVSGSLESTTITPIACSEGHLPLNCPSGSAFPEAEALFRRDPRWRGSGAALSLLLAPGRTLWLFSNTFIATSAAHTRTESKMVHNSIAVQTGKDPRTAAITFHWRQEPDGSPASFFPASEQHWYWPEQGIRLAEGPLVIFLSKLIATPGQGLGFDVVGYAVAVIDNPDASPDRWRPRIVDSPSSPFDAMPAKAVIQEGDYIVALATRLQADRHTGTFVRYPAARLAQGDVSNAEWWAGEGRGWVPAVEVGAAGPTFVLDDAGAGCSLHWDERADTFIHVASYGFGASTIGLRTAPALTGPWSSPVEVYRPPELEGPQAFVYGAKAHPELAGPDAADLLITYATNSFTFADLFTPQGEQSLYWPRFVLVSVGK